MAPRIVDREEKARQIIHHASVVFARKGYNATKIDDVAASAGIGKGTVYEYFNSKQDLFLAVFDAYIKQYFDALQAQTRRPSASAFPRSARSPIIPRKSLLSMMEAATTRSRRRGRPV